MESGAASAENALYDFRVFADYESAKHIFRASIKKYKESEAIYTLDEHATEHIELLKDLVGLYSHSLILEQSTRLKRLTEGQGRKEAINRRKIELLEPVIEALNPQHYMARVVELRVLAAETHTSLFEQFHSEFSHTGKKGRRMNKSGRKAIVHWEFVGEYMVREKLNNSQSFINCLYNVGRIYSKLRPKTNAEHRVRAD